MNQLQPRLSSPKHHEQVYWPTNKNPAADDGYRLPVPFQQSDRQYPGSNQGCPHTDPLVEQAVPDKPTNPSRTDSQSPIATAQHIARPSPHILIRAFPQRVRKAIYSRNHHVWDVDHVVTLPQQPVPGCFVIP